MTNDPTDAPRHYLILPPDISEAALAPALTGAEVACVALDTQGLTSAAIESAARRLMPPLQAQDIAFLLTDAAGLDRVLPLVGALDADGLHLSAAADYPAARKTLGKDRIVGVFCADSRHVAMEAAEAGADYVAFLPQPELIQIWAETMLVPCVAWDAPTDAHAALSAAGVEFLAYRPAGG